MNTLTIILTYVVILLIDVIGVLILRVRDSEKLIKILDTENVRLKADIHMVSKECDEQRKALNYMTYEQFETFYRENIENLKEHNLNEVRSMS